ncbi:hypothetical protein [Sphaerisporangium fuscum]|uniref:hypothetical protein n=1 Tax=Sphaerisporangium fuscum TaxID=2835868 RepID=UPI001BDD23EB|nr:hypothetical protein [Sphaerisporangium fuscum]
MRSRPASWPLAAAAAAVLAATAALAVPGPAYADTAVFTRTSSWDTGYNAQFTITDTTPTPPPGGGAGSLYHAPYVDMGSWPTPGITTMKAAFFDVEGSATAETASVTRRSQAIAGLQQANPGLKVSLTLPVLPEGLTTDGLNVVKSARDTGVDIDVVNVMAMDYYRSADYGDAAVQAAQSTFGQLRSLYPGRSDAQVWRMVGVTPMLSQNDDGHVYDQADARQLVTFAKGKHLGELAFWEMTRDRNACNGALYMCTNIAQSPYEFSKIFAGYAG